MTILVSLLFIIMIPIGCKITIIFLILVCLFFLRDCHNYFWHVQLLLNGKSVSQYTSFSLIFSSLRSVINGESIKSISTINATITENMKCLIVKVHVPVIDLKVGVSPVSLFSFRFQLFKHFI